MNISIYTDGSSKGNPGKGGYGIVLLSGSHRKEFSCGYKLTTNNRMELLAVIVGLEAIKNKSSKITVFSDSKYVINAVEKKWVFKWEKNGFLKKKNADLWKRFLNVYSTLSVSFSWVKGHSNNKENERCDFLAVSAASSNILKQDVWYENYINKNSSLF
tara:strand:+ start:96 stop:572 length:477 start_codon:yes stop_codon:yes gene_type:complete